MKHAPSRDHAPELAPDVALAVQAAVLLEERLGRHPLKACGTAAARCAHRWNRTGEVDATSSDGMRA